MIYDYGGFPDFTYQIHYDAPGDPALAARVKGLIEAAGMPARLDPERGFDHGAFTPLHVMYPQANVPVIQLSLKEGLDPVAHLALGRAIAPLRDENVLIVGSGLSLSQPPGVLQPARMGAVPRIRRLAERRSARRSPGGPRQTTGRLGERSVGTRGASARRASDSADGRRRCGG